MNTQEKIAQAAAACNRRDFKKAKSLLKEVIALDSNISEAYRLLGQIAYEEMDDESAIDNLLVALKLDEKNLWALIMLGNVFSKRKKDFKTAQSYYESVLEYYPDNALALTNVAAVMVENKKINEAIPLFKKAMALDESFPNCYYGLAMAYVQQEKFQEAFETALEGQSKSVDRPENGPVRKELTRILLHAAQEIADHSNYMKVVADIIKEFEAAGTKIEIQQNDNMNVYAKLKYAKHYNKDTNVILYNSKMKYVEYLIIHEMGHLRMMEEADKLGQAKVIHSTDKNNAFFNRKFGALILKQLSSKVPQDKIAGFITSLQEGLGLQLMNCPLDLFVERFIYEHYPVLRPVQLLMLYGQDKENIQGLMKGDANKFLPHALVKTTKVLNMCSSMHLKNLYHIDNLEEFHPTQDERSVAKDLFDEFLAYWEAKDLQPGEEYALVQYFLEALNMEDALTISDYKDFVVKVEEEAKRPMSVDAGDYDIYSEEQRERQRKFEEESKKEDGGRDLMMTMFILAALEEFSKMSFEKVKKIAIEIAMLGMKGIEPSKPSGYRIPSIDRDFGGYAMLAYYYTSWKLTIPESAEQLGLPYRAQYEDAQKLFKKKYGTFLSFL